uniref:FAD-binding PCMH-type domain-containing protein n=1 Tax=Timema poppense TaxID=170557 RepID=A0A7R9DCN0_TIMPO|nr:unnamed protein product [Timema poppensis]
MRQIADHLKLVANVPVRNIGTIAGNLVLKHKHNEFDSDVFLLLETVGAVLTIMDSSVHAVTVSPVEFLKLDMNHKLITQVMLRPLEPTYKFMSYKIMPRAKNVHAIVNAGFLFNLSSDGNGTVVERPNIVYGGINPSFVHATATESYLDGKDLFTQETLNGLMDSLEQEIQPDHVLPDMTPEYRKGLTKSLIYKCLLNLAAERVKSENKSGGTTLHRSVSSGVQTFQTDPSLYPLNQPIPKIEALVQWEAEYINDRPVIPGELFGAFVKTTIGNGTILSIDPSDALVRAPHTGVVKFYGAEDIPGKNSVIPYPTAFTLEKEELFCSGKVLYWGQPVGIIIAATRELANKAASKVKIEYSNVSKPVIHLSEVIDNERESWRIDSGHRKETRDNREEINSGETTHVAKGIFKLGFQYHFTMETITVQCIPTEDGIQIFASTMWMDLIQRGVSDVLAIPQNSIDVVVRRMGGGYGIKITRPNFAAAGCALAAMDLGRPVRMVMTMEANMEVFGKRAEVFTTYEAGVDDGGTIQYLKADLYENVGSSTNDPNGDLALSGIKNGYDESKWSVVAKDVRTNTPSSAYMRGPGTNEGIASIEYIMEHIANVVKKDPTEVRINNIPKDSPILVLFDAIKKSGDYDKRRTSLNEFNKVAQVCAYILGVPLDLVSIKASNTLTAANDIATGGSITSESCCYVSH